jgi:hypothetical protein
MVLRSCFAIERDGAGDRRKQRLAGIGQPVAKTFI